MTLFEEIKSIRSQGLGDYDLSDPNLKFRISRHEERLIGEVTREQKLAFAWELVDNCGWIRRYVSVFSPHYFIQSALKLTAYFSHGYFTVWVHPYVWMYPDNMTECASVTWNVIP